MDSPGLDYTAELLRHFADLRDGTPALLRRVARYISGAADLAANGGKLPDGIPETARNQLAATLRRDADGLIAITTTN
jgi:hypothetical protein